MDSEKLKTWLNFSKFFLGTFVLGLATILVNYHIGRRDVDLRQQEVLLKAEEVRLKKEEFNLAELEKISAIEIAELKSLGDYIEFALEANVAKRRRFSQYFATVTRSPELRQRWEEYDKLVKDEFESTETQLSELQSELHGLKEALARTKAEDIGKLHELEQKFGELTAKLEETEQELRVKSTTTARQISGGPRGVAIVTEGGLVSVQMLCCAIKLSGFPDRTYAITARQAPIQNAAGSEVRVGRRDGPRLGIVQDIQGTLEDGSANNLDAMLILVEDNDLLKQSLGGVRFSSFARSVSDIPQSYWLLASERRIRLKHARLVNNFSLNYGMEGRQNVVHNVLLESRSEGRVFPGSSGAPIASGPSGGMLLGMLIASDGFGKVLAIPAWQLFRPELYSGLSTQEELALYNPSKESSTDRSSE